MSANYFEDEHAYIIDEIDGPILDVTVGQKLDQLEIVEFLSRIHVALAWLEDVDANYILATEAQRIVDLVGDRPTGAVLAYLRRMISETLSG